MSIQIRKTKDQTPIHIRATKDKIAPFVIAPGDADRAKFIADNYLEQVVCYTEYRHLLGYTGTYKGLPVSIQTTGMGLPSSMIIFEELVSLGAQYIVRIGTCGGLQPYLVGGDCIVGISAWGTCSTQQTVATIVENKYYSPLANIAMSNLLFQKSSKKQKSYIGPIISNDLFYKDIKKHSHPLTDLGCLASEMEAAGLFALGAKYKIITGCILTVSDLIYSENLVRMDEDVILGGVKKNTRIILETFLQLQNTKK